MSRQRNLLFSVSMLGGLFVCGGASAQTAPSSTQAVSELIVTAERREQSVQRVGAAITAFTGQQLQSARIEQPADLATLTPGLRTLNRTADEAPSFAIRGVGLDDYAPNNTSGTAVYLDGIYETGPIFLATPMFDVQRVEVLKGPQGTLYGKNATGGAVSIFSVEPKNDTDGYATLGYGRYDTVDFRGAFNTPLSDTLSLRVSGTATRAGEGFQTDVDTGKQYGRPDRYAGRVLLKYDDGHGFSAVLNLHGSRDVSVPSSYEHDLTAVSNLTGVPVDPAQLDVIPADPTKVRVGPLGLRRQETLYGSSLTLNKDFGAASLVAIFGYDQISRFLVDNNDGLPQAFYDYTQNDRAKQYYGEARLASRAPLFGRVNWIVGASYSAQAYKGDDTVDASAGFFPLGVFSTPPDLNARGESVAIANFVQNPTAFGVFLHTSTSLTDGLRLVLGGRVSRDTAEVDGRSTENGSANGGILFHGIGATVAALDESHTSTKFSYKAGLEYDVAPHVMGYASISSGTKSGVFSLAPALDPASWRYVKPEVLVAYEVGLKSSGWDGRVVANVAAFHYDYTDRQTSVAFVSAVTGSFAASLDNLPKARIDGLDFDGILRPFPGFTLSGGVTYLDSAVVIPITNVSGQPLVLAVPKGTPLAQAPRYSASVSAAYQWRPTDKTLANLQLAYSYVSKETDALGDPLGEYGPDDELSGRVSLAGDNGWEVALWGKNLTDNRNLISAYLQIIGRTIYIRPPISYGLEVTRHF